MTAPVLLVVLFFVVYANFPWLYVRLVREDGPVEYAQACLFLAAAFVGLLTAVRLSRTSERLTFAVVLLFSAGCFLIFGEEISWGQRMVGFQTPALIEVMNTQREFTAHNLGFVQRYTFHAYCLVCAYACLAWFVIRVCDIGHRHVLRYVIPGWETITLFLPIALFYLAHIHFFDRAGVPLQERYVLWPQVPSWRHQETFELFFAAGFFALACRNWLMARSSGTGGAGRLQPDTGR